MSNPPPFGSRGRVGVSIDWCISDTPRDVDEHVNPQNELLIPKKMLTLRARQGNEALHNMVKIHTITGGEISESTAGPSQASETPVSTKQPPRRKARLVFSTEDENQAKKPKKGDELQQACDDCLVSGK